MRRFHIIGRKNHGKTQLIVELVKELTARGLRVGTIKHTHHEHELDTTGKDSWLHRQAGAELVGVLSRSLSAVFIPEDPKAEKESRYERLANFFSGCDLVLVEGNMAATAPRIEVWRSVLGTEPICASDLGVHALVTDDPPLLPPRCRCFPRKDLKPLVDWLCAKIEVEEMALA